MQFKMTCAESHLVKVAVIFFLIMACYSFAQSQEPCRKTERENYAAIFSFVYLMRNDLVSFDDMIKKYNLEDMRRLNASLVKNELSDVRLDFAFEKSMFLLQGNQPGQSARPAMNLDGDPIMPKPSIFIVYDVPKSHGKTFVIISDAAPPSTKILSVDRCFNVSLLFYSKKFNIDRYNRIHGRHPFYEDGEPMGYPVERVAISKNGVRLYEFKNPSPYLLSDLIENDKTSSRNAVSR